MFLCHLLSLTSLYHVFKASFAKSLQLYRFSKTNLISHFSFDRPIYTSINILELIHTTLFCTFKKETYLVALGLSCSGWRGLL